MSNMAITKWYLLFFLSGACKLESMNSCFSHVAHADQGQLDLRILITQNISQNISKTKKLKNFIFLKLKIFNVVSKKIKVVFVGCCFFGIGVRTISKVWPLELPCLTWQLQNGICCFSHVAHANWSQWIVVFPMLHMRIRVNWTWSPKTFSKTFPKPRNSKTLFFFKLKIFNVVSKKNKSCFCRLLFFWNRG